MNTKKKQKNGIAIHRTRIEWNSEFFIGFVLYAKMKLLIKTKPEQERKPNQTEKKKLV